MTKSNKRLSTRDSNSEEKIIEYRGSAIQINNGGGCLTMLKDTNMRFGKPIESHIRYVPRYPQPRHIIIKLYYTVKEARC